MIIATDFDGTIVQHRFPEIGEELPYAISTLKALREAGHKVFLWTMRGHPDPSRFDHTVRDAEGYESGTVIQQDTLQEALDWCKERGLEFDGVNESPAQFSTSNKQYATIYIDDAALGCPCTDKGVDWSAVIFELKKKGLLTLDQIYKILKICNGNNYRN